MNSYRVALRSVCARSALTALPPVRLQAGYLDVVKGLRQGDCS